MSYLYSCAVRFYALLTVRGSCVLRNVTQNKSDLYTEMFRQCRSYQRAYGDSDCTNEKTASNSN
jgi:hypothetical protein